MVLLHTHATSSGVENIERTGPNANCEQTGDGLCSTPADPNLLNQLVDPAAYKVDTSCNYTAGETRNGLPYDPDTSNFMSYSRRYCRDSFTQEQGDLMYTMIQSVPALQQVVSSSCAIPELTGSDLICSGDTYTYNLDNPPGGVTWTTGTNLDIVSSTGSSITVETASSNSQGEGFITANYNNGAEAIKTVDVGEPYAILWPVQNICTNRLNEYIVPASDGAESYRLVASSPGLTIDGTNEVTYFSAPFTVSLSTTQAGNHLIELFTTNDCGTSRGALYITAEHCGPGGGAYAYTLYPNPASKEITLQNNAYEKESQITTTTTLQTGAFTIYNFSGAVVKTGEYPLNRESFNLDVTDLQEGKYFIKIGAAREEETHQIVIRR